MTPEEAAAAAEALYLTIFTKSTMAEIVEVLATALLVAAKPKGDVMTQDQLDALVDFIRAEAEKAAEDGDPDGSFRMAVRERLKSLYEAFGLETP